MIRRAKTSDYTEVPDEQRRAREAAMIAQADASVEAGRVVDEAEVDAWIDSIGTSHELPVPSSGRRAPVTA